MYESQEISSHSGVKILVRAQGPGSESLRVECCLWMMKHVCAVKSKQLCSMPGEYLANLSIVIHFQLGFKFDIGIYGPETGDTRPPSCLSQFSLTFFINVIIRIWIQKFWYDFVLVTASCSGSDAAWSERPVDWWLVRSAQFLAFLGVESDNLCWKKSSFNAPWADRFSCH